MGADGAGDFPYGNVGARFGEACAVASDFAQPNEEFEAKGDRLGVDAVAAADHQRVLERHRLVGQDVFQRGEPLVHKVRGVDQLQCQAGIQDVA